MGEEGRLEMMRKMGWGGRGVNFRNERLKKHPITQQLFYTMRAHKRTEEGKDKKNNNKSDPAKTRERKKLSGAQMRATTIKTVIKEIKTQKWRWERANGGWRWERVDTQTYYKKKIERNKKRGRSTERTKPRPRIQLTWRGANFIVQITSTRNGQYVPILIVITV